MTFLLKRGNIESTTAASLWANSNTGISQPLSRSFVRDWRSIPLRVDVCGHYHAWNNAVPGQLIMRNSA
ncbi:MAG: hypothetical protein AAF434_00165 [Pseudomonadota bacterium]